MSKRFITNICFAVLILYAITVTIVSPFLSEISKTFSLTMAQSGLVFTVIFIGFVSFVFIGGILSDRMGMKKVIICSLIGFTLSLFLFPFAKNFYLACFILFMLGGSGGVVQSTSNALIAKVNSEHSSFYINLAQVFFGIGAVIGPITAGIMISSKVPWQMYYFILSGLALLLLIVFILTPFPALQKSESITLTGLKSLVADKRFLLICFCMFLYTGSEVGSWGWMSTFLNENLNFSTTKSSLSVSVFWMSMTVGRLLCGYLTYRFQLKHIIMVLAFISAGFTALTVVTYSEPVMWLIIVAMGLFFSSQWPLIVSYGSNSYKNYSGTVFALLIGCGGFGTTVIPYIMGVIGEKTNIRYAMINPTLFLLILAFIFVFLKNNKPATS